ncbi:MAG: response regulator transcription factor [Kiritimatiellia bacterium]
MEILLAEDNRAIREGLVVLLESEGYEVRAAQDGMAAMELYHARRPDLILLDVAMPKRSGYAVCEAIRKTDTSTPILFLTAKDGDMDELRGLSIGADDYISKTASEPILLARIAGAARRVKSRQEEKPGVFKLGSCLVDGNNYRVTSPSGRQSDLSLNELRLIHLFADNPDELLTRDYLITQVWGIEWEGEESALTVGISRLREKLGSDGIRIQTVYGQGYRFNSGS